MGWFIIISQKISRKWWFFSTKLQIADSSYNNCIQVLHVGWPYCKGWFLTPKYMSYLMSCGSRDFFHQVVGKLYPNLTPPRMYFRCYLLILLQTGWALGKWVRYTQTHRQTWQSTDPAILWMGWVKITPILLYTTEMNGKSDYVYI